MQAYLLKKLAAMPAGTVFFTAAFTEECQDSQVTVRRFLKECSDEGMILPIARGLYCKPRRTSAGVALPPDLDKVLTALIRHYQVDAVPMGLSAAWRLGLIPDRPNPYLLAVSRGQYKVRFNGWEFQLLPGRIMPFQYKTELAAMLLTALPAIGEQHLTMEHATTLKRLILDCPDREAFREDVARLPVWMKNYLRRL